MQNYPKTPKGWRSAMVQWHVPKRKRPIAYSTKATSDIITTLMGDLTIKELRDCITYDVEVKQVLDEYIKRGFGDWICRERFQKWDRRHAYIPEDKRGFIEVERGEDGRENKTCPFCGSDSIEVYTHYGESAGIQYGGYYPECTVCGCRLNYYDSREEALKAWNRRADNDK